MADAVGQRNDMRFSATDSNFVVLLIVVGLVSSCARRPRSSEIFTLRSKCAELSDSFAQVHSKIDPHSHYDADANRCYVEVRDVQVSGETAIHLCEVYDAQTGQPLVRISSSHSGTTNAFQRSTNGETRTITPEAATTVINRLMADDRTPCVQD